MSEIRLGRPPSHLQHKHERKYQIKNIQGRQFTVIRYLAMGRLTQKQIAAIVGYTVVEVSTIANSAVARKQIDLMRGSMDKRAMDIAEHIEKVIAPKAVTLLEEILDNESKEGESLDAPLRLRADVAKTILSRAGYGETSKHEVKGAIAVFDGSAIEDIKRRAEERKAKEIQHEEVSSE